MYGIAVAHNVISVSCGSHHVYAVRVCVCVCVCMSRDHFDIIWHNYFDLKLNCTQATATQLVNTLTIATSAGVSITTCISLVIPNRLSVQADSFRS